MPHDKAGKELQVGDLVYVPCVIRDIQPTDEYCNVSLVTKENMFPIFEPSFFTLNSKQVLKVE